MTARKIFFFLLLAVRLQALFILSNPKCRTPSTSSNFITTFFKLIFYNIFPMFFNRILCKCVPKVMFYLVNKFNSIRLIVLVNYLLINFIVFGKAESLKGASKHYKFLLSNAKKNAIWQKNHISILYLFNIKLIIPHSTSSN